MTGFKKAFASRVEKSFGRDKSVMEALRAGDEGTLKILLTERAAFNPSHGMALLKGELMKELEVEFQVAIDAKDLLELLNSGQATASPDNTDKNGGSDGSRAENSPAIVLDPSSYPF